MPSSCPSLTPWTRRVCICYDVLFSWSCVIVDLGYRQTNNLRGCGSKVHPLEEVECQHGRAGIVIVNMASLYIIYINKYDVDTPFDVNIYYHTPPFCFLSSSSLSSSSSLAIYFLIWFLMSLKSSTTSTYLLMARFFHTRNRLRMLMMASMSPLRNVVGLKSFFILGRNPLYVTANFSCTSLSVGSKLS